jgi:poly-beta-1,6-N-acetyl-D-glucosamine synthase
VNSRKIAIVSPVRNEEAFIEATLSSMVAQAVAPMRWIIVDDGSTDRTFEIASAYAAKHDWITVVRKPDRGQRSVGPGVVEAFNFGMSHVPRDVAYICKMDGDIELPRSYFQTLLERFEADPLLGAASGKPFIRVGGRLVPEKTSDEMVAGQINFYRRACFEDIGGFVQEVHWDAIAFHRARMSGWRTASFHDESLRFLHLRLMGSSHQGIVTGRKRWGKGQYFIGTHPLYLLAIVAYRMLERPFFIGGAFILVGYVQAFFRRDRRYEFPGFRKSLHAWQFERLGLGKRLEST